MLNEKDKESLDRLNKAEKEAKEQEEIFWNNEYPAMSKEERAKCWAADMHRSMRDRAEYGYSKYGLYTSEWLEYALDKDSKFMELLPEIFRIWSGVWDSIKVERILKKRYKYIMKNINKKKQSGIKE